MLRQCNQSTEIKSHNFQKENLKLFEAIYVSKEYYYAVYYDLQYQVYWKSFQR